MGFSIFYNNPAGRTITAGAQIRLWAPFNGLAASKIGRRNNGVEMEGGTHTKQVPSPEVEKLLQLIGWLRSAGRKQVNTSRI